MARIRDLAEIPFPGTTYPEIQRLAAFTIPEGVTVLENRDIAVSGVILAPTGAAPTDGRPVVSWAHPTTGVAPACAPSLSPAQAVLIPGLAGMLQAGYVVAATDYPGLGTSGPHPYRRPRVSTSAPSTSPPARATASVATSSRFSRPPTDGSSSSAMSAARARAQPA